MFNNIYVKIKNFMKRNIGLILFVIAFLTVTMVRLPYDVNMPGGTINLSDRIQVNGNDVSIEGTFNMAYVSSVTGSIPHILLSYLIPDWDITPSSNSTYENETIEEIIEPTHQKSLLPPP